ncbi:MAG: AAA-like domain-containing protein [Cyanobacteria bacterium J06641_5]
MVGDRESLEAQLTRMRRALEILLAQKAGFGLRVPVDLELEIEEKQAAVACLEGKLNATSAEAVGPQVASASAASVAVQGDVGALGNEGTIGNTAGSVGRDQIHAETVVINNYVTPVGSEDNSSLPVPEETRSEKLQEPMLAGELEFPGGTMPTDSPFYVRREALERDCYAQLDKPGGLIRIEAPRQMGKSSFMAQLRHYAETEQGYRIVSLSFQELEDELLQDLDALLYDLCDRVGEDLGLNLETLDALWERRRRGPKRKCSQYFEGTVLPAVGAPLVLVLDEVDRLFPQNAVAVEFLAMLRTWREQGVTEEPWKQLRIVLVHSTEAYVEMPVSSSPFNVGLRVQLPEFSMAQVLWLAQRHGLDWQAEQEVAQLMELMGGHPYLVRLAMYWIARQKLTLDRLVETAATEAEIYGDFLKRYLEILQGHGELLQAFQQALPSEEPVQVAAKAAKQLHGLGLVTLDGNGVRVRYGFYRTYFRKRLGV